MWAFVSVSSSLLQGEQMQRAFAEAEVPSWRIFLCCFRHPLCPGFTFRSQ